MAGNVLVDDPGTEESPPPKAPGGWVLGMAAIVLAFLLFFPGGSESTAPTTTLAFPEVETGEAAWTEVDLPGDGALTDAVLLESGAHVAVGEGPQIWHYDGNGLWEWQSGTPDHPGALHAVAGYGTGAVAVGWEDRDGRESRAAVWSSADGRNWSQAELPVSEPSALTGVHAADGRVVAWGWEGEATDFSPRGRSIVITSEDGVEWEPMTALDGMGRLARVSFVTFRDGSWYAGGYATGRPAVWTTTSGDLASWEEIERDALPFGWTVTDVEPRPDGLWAELVDLSDGRVRDWIYRDGDWEALDALPREPIRPVSGREEDVGIGRGRLWERNGESWDQLVLQGRIVAADARMAVGAGPQLQPRAWIHRGSSNDRVTVPQADDGQWEVVRDMGPGTDPGAWPVADGWVIGGGQGEWWYMEGAVLHSFRPPWGYLFSKIVPVGDEWVALPTLHWSDDGVTWAQRASPWNRAGASGVEAMSGTDRILAVGRDRRHEWNVSESADSGTSWSRVEPTGTPPPIWSVSGIDDGGFVASTGRSRDAREIVTSDDGWTWEPLATGSLLGESRPPAVVTEDGRVVLLDSAEELHPPRVDITAVARGENGLVLVAGDRMWVGQEEWEEIPLDPPHNMDAAVVEPVPVDGRLMAVGADRGRILLYEWVP